MGNNAELFRCFALMNCQRCAKLVLRCKGSPVAAWEQDAMTLVWQRRDAESSRKTKKIGAEHRIHVLLLCVVDKQKPQSVLVCTIESSSGKKFLRSARSASGQLEVCVRQKRVFHWGSRVLRPGCVFCDKNAKIQPPTRIMQPPTPMDVR